MIYLTRLLAKQLRLVGKKALGINNPARMPPLTCSAGADGLRFRIHTADRAVEYHLPGAVEPDALRIPFAALADVEGSKPDPVTFHAPRPDTLVGTWDEKGFLRSLEYPAPPSEAESPFPAIPETLIPNPPSLLTALRDAYDTTDPDSSRFALSCVQLRGESGQIAATDGRHLLLESGFQWGFAENVLLQRTTVFGVKELAGEAEVLVGKTEGQIVFRTGPWTLWLPIEKEGRFPQIEHSIPPIHASQTTLDLNPADAEYLAENAHRLPFNTGDKAVTLDLNGSVLLRAKTADTPRGTEMLLVNSAKTGADLRVCLHRRYLIRAARLGLSRIHFNGADAAIHARDDRRSYVWMPLAQDGVVPPSDDQLRIQSPLGATVRSHSKIPSRSTLPVPPANPSAVPSPPVSHSLPGAVRRRRPADKSAAGSLEQAFALRDQLRGNLAAVKELIRRLQAERKHQRLLKSTLASLKELQRVA